MPPLMTYNEVTRKLARQLTTILKEWDFRTPTVEEYFVLSCNDVLAGAKLDDLYSSIKLFEQIEAFEECEGILLACQLCTTLTIQIYLNE